MLRKVITILSSVLMTATLAAAAFGQATGGL
jgi:hypothetical protein